MADHNILEWHKPNNRKGARTLSNLMRTSEYAPVPFNMIPDGGRFSKATSVDDLSAGFQSGTWGCVRINGSATTQNVAGVVNDNVFGGGTVTENAAVTTLLTDMSAVTSRPNVDFRYWYHLGYVARMRMGNPGAPTGGFLFNTVTYYPGHEAEMIIVNSSFPSCTVSYWVKAEQNDLIIRNPGILYINGIEVTADAHELIPSDPWVHVCMSYETFNFNTRLPGFSIYGLIGNAANRTEWLIFAPYLAPGICKINPHIRYIASTESGGIT